MRRCLCNTKRFSVSALRHFRYRNTFFALLMSQNSQIHWWFAQRASSSGGHANELRKITIATITLRFAFGILRKCALSPLLWISGETVIETLNNANTVPIYCTVGVALNFTICNLCRKIDNNSISCTVVYYLWNNTVLEDSFCFFFDSGVCDNI